MILSEIFAGGITGLLGGVKEIISSVKADPLELLKLEAAVKQAELQAQLLMVQAQTKINEIEAASTDKFVSRWRPACGWIGFIGLAYATLAHPLLTWASLNFGIMPPPALDTTILMEVVMGMLGLAGLRTYEKVQKP